MVTKSLSWERTGARLNLEAEVARGAEGKIVRIAGEPALMAKLYLEPSAERSRKLSAMLSRPPMDPTGREGHISIAWPIDRILDEQQSCVGFVMPAMDVATTAPLFQLYHPEDRRRIAPGFSWQYLLRTARNLCAVVHALNDNSYVVGDLNDRNVLVSNTAMVTLVDCDSMQVPRADGTTFRCAVGTPEFTPGELQGMSFAAIDRSWVHDSFALTALIFQLLMEGIHPFAGVWRGKGDAPSLFENIRKGAFPYAKLSDLAPPLAALPFETLPLAIQALFQRCFIEGHTRPIRRPPAHEWLQVLSEAEQHLSQCQHNMQHRYSRHLSECPWCRRVARGIPDPFPAPLTQHPLEPVPLISEKRKATGIPVAPRGATRAKHTVTIAIAGNRCGGKTTTAINLAACLAEAGYRVLLVDMSPGAEATTGLGLDAHHVGLSMYELLVDDHVTAREVMMAGIRPNLSLLPAKVDLYAADIELVYIQERREHRLEQPLEDIKDQFDFILIDCPCYEGGALYHVAFTAADGVLLTLKCQHSTFQGIEHLLNTIQLVHDRLNPRIQLFGVVLTMFEPRTKLGTEVVREVSEHFPKEMFRTLIPRNVRLAEAPGYGQTILEHEPRSPGALAYKELAEEVAKRAAIMASSMRQAP